MRGQVVYPCLFVLLLASSLEADKSAPRLTPKTKPITSPVRPPAPENFYRLPLHFEPLETGSAFLSRGPGYALMVDGEGVRFSLRRPRMRQSLKRSNLTTRRRGESPDVEDMASQQVAMRLPGSRRGANVEAMERMEGITNYFLGSDSAKWRSGVPHFAKLKLREVYAGVDLVYYGNQRQLEYDFIVKPGADPSAIRLAWDGVRDLRVDRNGDLLLEVEDGELRQLRPRIYQEVRGKRVEIAGSYQVLANREVTFALARYDRTKPLVIDPVMSYASYIGGNLIDAAYSIAVDDQGSAYIAGQTESANFRRQVNSSGFQTTIRTPISSEFGDEQYDAFVVKLNSSGTGIVYSTFLGGTDYDAARGIAVDSARNVYVVGDTFSGGSAFNSFPTAGVGSKTTNTGRRDGFLAKLNATGTALVYSTYIGTANEDRAYSVVVSGGSAFVTGWWNIVYQASTNSDLGDIFAARYGTGSNGSQEALRVIGGSGNDIGFDLDADSLGNIYLTGRVESGGLQTGGTSYQGGGDSFLARLNSNLTLLSFTYLGGGARDDGIAIAVTPLGEAYITGESSSSSLGNTLYGKNGTAGDAYVARFSNAGTLTHFGYFGGSRNDFGDGIAVDSSGTAYIAGFSESADFPVSPFASQRTSGGQHDVFVIRVSPQSGSNPWNLLFSTYFGGSQEEGAADIAVSSSGVFVTGTATAGPNNATVFPAAETGSILSPAYGGGQTDAFVARLASATVNFSLTSTYGPPSSGTASTANFRLLQLTTATNTGTVAADSCGTNTGGGVGGVGGCPNCTGVGANQSVSTVIATNTNVNQTCTDQPVRTGCETNNSQSSTNDNSFTCPSVNPRDCAPSFTSQAMQVDSSLQDRDITLEIPNDCSWNVQAELNSFIQVLNPVISGDSTLPRGRGTVRFRVQANNTGQPRSARLVASSVALGEVRIDQSAASTGIQVGISPAQVTLTAGQSATFTSSISGTTNTTTPFSITPQEGTLELGQFSPCLRGGACVYTAPSVITFTHSITITTYSLQDPSKSASATIILQAGPPSSGLRFVALAPCRLMETRAEYNFQGRTGAFGPPYMRAGETRTLTVSNSNVCQVPSTAKAFVFNVTLVPRGGVDFATIWPGGEARPDFWTIRSPDGQTVANSAIVKSGNGSIQVYTSNDTDVLIDISGYMTDSAAVSNLVYYPLTPCRVIDTRAEYRPAVGPFGPPSLNARETRRFRFPSTPYCSVPAGAAAYSVTLTVAPPAALQFLSAWAAATTQPNVSNINSPAGRVLANSVIVPASGDGSLDVFAFDRSDLLVDINGYFAPDDGANGLYYYPVTQCRVSDSRNFNGTFGGPIYGDETNRTIPVPSSACAGIPTTARGFVINATVMPSGSPMPFLTVFPTGQARPNASLLNAFQGQTVTSSSIIPAGTNGSIDVFAYRRTHVVIEVSGYFGR